MTLFLPLSFVLNAINQLLLGKKDKERDFISREEVEFLFHKEQPSEKYEDEKDFIYRVLNLSEIKLKEIMIPLNEVSAIPKDAARDDVLETLEKEYFSRLPVYSEEIFNIIGYIPSRDFLFYTEKGVSDLLEETLFFPETKPANEALFEMQKAKKPLVFLVDEYGAVSGIVTKEDVVELIVGNIQDELHREEAVIPIKDGIIVPGWESVEILNEEYDLKIEKDDFDTLSGFVAYILGKIPEAGDCFEYKENLYRVLQASNRIATKIKITGGGFS
jgi:putative hemolysin